MTDYLGVRGCAVFYCASPVCSQLNDSVFCYAGFEDGGKLLRLVFVAFLSMVYSLVTLRFVCSVCLGQSSASTLEPLGWNNIQL